MENQGGNRMEKRDYKLYFDTSCNLEETCYPVIAGVGRYGVPGSWSYLPIKIDCIQCTDGGTEIDIVKLMRPLPCNDEDVEDTEFKQHYLDILRGEIPDWILGEFEVLMTGICLIYYNASKDVKETLNLNIAHVSNREAHLHIKFSVPHCNGKPDTEYWYNGRFYYSTEKPDSWTTLNKLGYDTQSAITFYLNDDHDPRRMLEFDAIQPDYAHITEYIDY